MPAAVEPELALLVSEAPHTADWLHEIKFDGYRLLCHVTSGKARLMTRRQLDWTARFPSIAQAAAKLPVKSVILDGEAVVLEPNGVSSFQALQSALSEKAYDRMFYYVFDILYLDGYDLRGVILEDRKKILASVLARQTATSRIHYCDHIEGDGPEFLRQCCGHGLEGIISKRRDRPYLAGRGGDWVKAKCIQHEEFVIGGFTDPTGTRQGFGAILIGYYDRPGHLLYAGRVGTGFSTEKLVDLRRTFDKLETHEPTFANLTARQAGRGVHWTKPKLVCQVQFTNWTRDHVLRHPSFQGLREDLPSTAVVRDAPVPGGLAEGAKTATLRRAKKVVQKSVAARHRGGSR
ncbi:MAG TPA: non-homologous end-joining DNA ligase [Pirellulales bacterium]|jgi:bifunctional non-homologous end joining protein LigD